MKINITRCPKCNCSVYKTDDSHYSFCSTFTENYNASHLFISKFPKPKSGMKYIVALYLPKDGVIPSIKINFDGEVYLSTNTQGMTKIDEIKECNDEHIEKYLDILYAIDLFQ